MFHLVNKFKTLNWIGIEKRLMSSFNRVIISKVQVSKKNNLCY